MINIIVAMTKNHGIGYNNKLPWYIPDDLKRFKKLTTGSIIVMGRKTWDSLPIKPLPNRKNIILSRDNISRDNISRDNISRDISNENILFINDLNLINNIKSDIWIIGGSEIYKLALNKLHIDNIYVTEINNDYECDKFFPEIPNNFNISYEEYNELYSYKIYKNIYKNY
jgi:dihydrofolate reductase